MKNLTAITIPLIFFSNVAIRQLAEIISRSRSTDHKIPSKLQRDRENRNVSLLDIIIKLGRNKSTCMFSPRSKIEGNSEYHPFTYKQIKLVMHKAGTDYKKESV